ncbi:MAG: hypothetical protein HOO06_16390 [Bdellovibrionaceae bacterium]|jgi:DNA repair photolyase|nr:hypothetical protein [Pseudobdellovibrionaceae bacterium]
MSDHNDLVSYELKGPSDSNVVSFPTPEVTTSTPIKEKKKSKELVPTPTYDKISINAKKLDKLSKYPCDFDYTIYKQLEERYAHKNIRGGIVKNNAMKLVNSHSSCQQCFYALEIDTYGRGCSHNCLYCYAKAQLTVYGYWNNPIPVPIDINEIRTMFYTVFETDKKSKWRKLLEQRIPLRVGCMSDSFMWMDHKYKVSQEFLKILNYYDYPYTILTRSDLIARDDYVALLRKDLCSVQFSVASTNDKLNKLIEPGTPSAKRRLKAVGKLAKEGLWTTVRINPIFPIHPDGYFTDPDFKWDGDVPKFNYTTFDMVDEIAATGTPSIITGFGRFSGYALNNIEKATGIDLKPYFDREKVCKSSRDWHFSEKEIRYYYEEFKRRCDKAGVEKTVCYIGNGESQFWDHQDLWSNKKDCCNIKDRVSSFKADTRQVLFEDRLKFASQKCSTPIDVKNLHTPVGEVSESEKFLKSIKRPKSKELDNSTEVYI